MRQSTRSEVKRIAKAKKRLLGAVQSELMRQDITALELLAVIAHTTGACIAYQDRNTVKDDQALELVWENIRQGNAEALAEVMSVSGRPN
ncbi:MAG: hypothetical protein AAGL89_12810 [Pseudomonadota bacterium]